MNYHWSYYNIDEKFENFHIIFNTKTSAVIKINNEVYQQIQDLITHDLDKIIDNNLALLTDKGFLVSAETNEFLEIKERYLKNFYDKNRLNLTILPAEYCNLTCPYCFIYNYAGCFLNEKLEKDIINFVKKRILTRDIKKPFYARINWYGGEPLLGKDKILNMMKEIKSFIDLQNTQNSDKHIFLESSIITNGVLLSPDLFINLLRCGVNIFQITFDGGKKYHDKTRCDKKGNGSFDTILHNLKLIKKLPLNDKFIFSIRINFMKNSLNSIYPLIDLLADIIGSDKRFMIYCRPVYNFETSRDSIETVESEIFSIEEGLKVQKELSEYISEKTNSSTKHSLLDSLLPYTRQSWCFEDNDYSFIVGANGNIYKCDTLIGDQKFSIGTLKNGDIAINNNDSFWIKNIFELEEFKNCLSCKLLPICFGGCKRNKADGNSGCFFDVTFIRNNIREYIKKGGEK